jgi:metallo-beta-lactamase family protein
VGARLSISFHGAARTVTGSRHRIDFESHAWLFDCGLYQGHREEADRVNRTFRFAPADLETVVLSHAHLDHSGNLPTLVNHGYAGRIHATPATVDLCGVMLADSAFLQERDVDHVNRRARAHGGPEPREPLYTVADVEVTMRRFETHAYHDSWSPAEGVEVRYYDAGHILGSALTTFDFSRQGRRYRLGMSGDLGRPNRPILRDPESHPGVDALVLESTYGDRLHSGEAATRRDLIEILTRTIERGGRVMIPAFAVGRAQEVVAELHDLVGKGLIPDVPLFVDSPMASSATAIFRHHPELFDDETRRSFAEQGGAPLGFSRLRYVSTADESRALNDRQDPCIILAASGMCEGGRILHHLRHGLSEPRNTVLFVGFQAEGTLGRRIQEGADVVSIFGDPVRRRAEVASLDGFSAHADQNELVSWVGGLQPRPKKVFLVHGEFEAAGVLAERLTNKLGLEVHIPALGDRFDLWN